MSESSLFLSADEQPLTLGQALRYLESSGKLKFFLWEIICQHVIEKELQTQQLAINPDVIDQMVIDFRLENQLTDYESFQEWLASEGIDSATFRQQIAFNLKLEKLKATVAQPNLQEYFIERKLFLDQVVLSRLVVKDKELAEELRNQVVEDNARFEQLAQEYSVTEERIFNGMMGAVSRGSMPDALRAAVDSANPGDLLGPLEIQELWYLVRVEKFLNAALDEQLGKELQDELFEKWLNDKVRAMNVKLEVNF
jgi:parvulin-like peptidyl-prolyl isomerase